MNSKCENNNTEVDHLDRFINKISKVVPPTKC